MNYENVKKLSIKTHPVLNERWVRDHIAGDLIHKDKERYSVPQKNAIRLEACLSWTDEVEDFLESAGLDMQKTH